MTRRDRTTGLPASAVGRRAAARAGDERRLFAQRVARYGIIGTAAAALLAVAALLAFTWYDGSIAQPRKVVLRVGAEEFSLSYYAARLPEFARADPSGGGLLVTQSLLNTLEEEGLTLIAAAARGIELSDEEVTGAIALELGVVAPEDAAGDAVLLDLYDNRYREELRTSGLSNAHFRQRARARATEREFRTLLREDVGETGLVLRLRVVTAATLEEAEAIRARIVEGEDMGTIAQVDSLHTESRQNDGLLSSPPALLDTALREALAEAEAGTLLEPVEAEGVFWVARLEEREPEGAYTEDHISEFTERRFQEAIEAARSGVTIERDLTTDDANWALEKAG